jgi:hypothetical protein
MIPNSLTVALKEWAVVSQALSEARQILLLRKGGIYEAAGEFELEHREFLLFPTYVHQNPDMLKSEQRANLQVMTSEPQVVNLSLAAQVTDIIPVQSRAAMDALDDQHVWTKPLIDMRFNYKPQNPLYLLLVRAYRLREPAAMANTPAYAGCKSWVPLESGVSTGGAVAVLDEARYQSRREIILKRLEGAR